MCNCYNYNIKKNYLVIILMTYMARISPTVESRNKFKFFLAPFPKIKANTE